MVIKTYILISAVLAAEVVYGGFIGNTPPPTLNDGLMHIMSFQANSASPGTFQLAQSQGQLTPSFNPPNRPGIPTDSTKIFTNNWGPGPQILNGSTWSGFPSGTGQGFPRPTSFQQQQGGSQYQQPWGSGPTDFAAASGTSNPNMFGQPSFNTALMQASTTPPRQSFMQSTQPQITPDTSQGQIPNSASYAGIIGKPLRQQQLDANGVEITNGQTMPQSIQNWSQSQIQGVQSQPMNGALIRPINAQIYQTLNTGSTNIPGQQINGGPITQGSQLKGSLVRPMNALVRQITAPVAGSADSLIRPSSPNVLQSAQLTRPITMQKLVCLQTPPFYLPPKTNLLEDIKKKLNVGDNLGAVNVLRQYIYNTFQALCYTPRSTLDYYYTQSKNTIENSQLPVYRKPSLNDALNNILAAYRQLINRIPPSGDNELQPYENVQWQFMNNPQIIQEASRLLSIINNKQAEVVQRILSAENQYGREMLQYIQNQLRIIK